MTRRTRASAGTFDRPVSAHPELRHVNDGGHDAPLTPRGRIIFLVSVFAIVLVFIVLGALAHLGH